MEVHLLHFCGGPASAHHLDQDVTKLVLEFIV